MRTEEDGRQRDTERTIRPSSLRWLTGLVAEQTTLLGSLVKWTTLAVAVGILAGCATTLFLSVLEWAMAAMARAPGRLLWLPLGFAGAHVLVRVLAPEAAGHGTDKVIEAVQRRWGRIPSWSTPVKLVATVLTIAVGGSVGKEGPAAQIGASLASGLASLLRLRPRDRRKLVICGIGAGFATVFGTPIAGAIFGLEVLVLGSLMYDVLYPSFVAGIVGHQVARRLGVTYFHQALYEIPRPTEGILLKTIAAGVVFGLVACRLIGPVALPRLGRRLLDVPGHHRRVHRVPVGDLCKLATLHLPNLGESTSLMVGRLDLDPRIELRAIVTLLRPWLSPAPGRRRTGH